MTDANPAFDTVHPSGHILVRSCRGGYMHSVALSEEAMETDAETLAQGILLTADVSCLKALLEVRDEIVAAGHTPSAEVPTPRDLDAAIEKLLALDPRGLYDTCRNEEISMCGLGPAVVMLTALNALEVKKSELVKYATSGDASGDRDAVVGYAGMIFS